MIRIGRKLIVGAITAFALMLAAMLGPEQFNTLQSAAAGTPAFRSTVKAALAPLPSGCTANPHTNPVLRSLSAVKVTRVSHLCQLGRESRWVFRKYTTNPHVKAIWLPRHVKCADAPNPKWAGRCYYVRQILRNHFQRLVWVRGVVTKLTTPVIVQDSLYSAFLCIHRYEGAWDANTGNGYYGGLQMDMSFQSSYGGEFLARWGTANNWPVWAQIQAAERAYRSGRGFYPWPNTARACGLI